jgi:Ca2+-binding EF-hand superfamily protein
MEADASPDFSMSKLDKNKDGVVDKQEAKASGKLNTIFDKSDANKDGKIDATELAAAAQTAKGN